MNTLRKRFIDISNAVGHEMFRDWLLEAIDHYKSKENTTMELREHVSNFVEREYNNYQLSVAYKIMMKDGGREE